MGYLYRQKLRNGRLGRIWWCKYYVNGRPVRESTGTDRETEARRVATGQPILPRIDRIRYEEIAADLWQHYRAMGIRNLREFAYRVKHLDRFFAGRRVPSIGSADVEAYIVARQAEGATGTTIKRELSTLSRMLRLAYENGKLLRLPVIRKPKEGAPREGFFERDQYESGLRHLPSDLRVAAAIA